MVLFSVRIQTKQTFNGGLFIADFFSMPHGCSVWPAYWSVGPNWPYDGEIDLIGASDQYVLLVAVLTNTRDRRGRESAGQQSDHRSHRQQLRPWRRRDRDRSSYQRCVHIHSFEQRRMCILATDERLVWPPVQHAGRRCDGARMDG